jgi:hypothetical protein
LLFCSILALSVTFGDSSPKGGALKSCLVVFTNPPKTAILYIVVSKRGGGTMEQELERLEGTVEDIIYLNEDNGYTVFSLTSST